MLTINNILCPVDFSEVSNSSLPYAKEMARNSGAKIILLYVAAENFTDPYGVETISLDQPERSKKDAEAKLDKLAASIKNEVDNIQIETRVIQGNALEVITRVAEETNADLIVMASHGRSGFGRLLMGSVAEWVFRNAPCPVLMIKGTEKDLA